MKQTSLFLLLCALPRALGQEECTLACQSAGASCAFGVESPFALPDEARSVDGMYCACPAERVGLYCQVPVVECDDNHKCYHGGQCLASMTSHDINLEERFCDCSNALDSHGSLFVGKYCEHKAASFCGNDPTHFCLHGGSCNGPDSLEPCTCPTGLTGDHCQFDAVQVPECDLACQNGGVCRLGVSEDPVLYPGDHHMHCVCADGYTGKYCDANKTPCGPDGDYCYHGSTCVPRSIEGGGTIYQCDCTATSGAGALYAGRFCQYEATSYCTLHPTVDGHSFCVNGGTCRPDELGCDCEGTGFGGYSCEIPVYDTDGDGVYEVSEEDQCTLVCENGGVCRNGAKELGLAGDVDAEQATYDEETFQHCMCPDGFTGLKCENMVEVCGENEHLCFHGSKCIQDGEDHTCDCSEANNDVAGAFAGDSCQHPANDICTYGNVQPGQAVNFCVNRGECRSIVAPGQPHPGCSCREGWTGPHCEIRNGNAAQPLEDALPKHTASSVSNNNGNGLNGFLMFMAVVGFLAFPSAIVVFCMRLRRRRSQERDQIKNNQLSWASKYRDNEDNEVNIAPRRSSTYDDVYMASIRHEPGDVLDDGDAPPPQVYLGPPRDEDGHELHSVEIL